MGGRDRAGQRGIALATAIVAALVVSITALVVLNLTMKRFELSAFRSDHTISLVSSEAGFQYAFARLDLDPVFRAAVENKTVAANTPTPYIVSSDPLVAADQTDPRLRVAKDVTLEITFLRPQDNPPDPNRPYVVASRSEFGTGGP